MDRNEIAALAKGMIPFVRETVTEAITPLAARIAELEVRPVPENEPGEKGAQGDIGPPGPPGPKGDSGEFAKVPPEIAAQVADAVRLLHEAPLPTPPTPAAAKSPPRVSRIERDDDGNLIPIYDGGQP